jgi:NADPH:quinone reductase
MRAVEVIEFGGPEKLRLMDVQEPTAEPGQVRVRVAAATVNPTDATTAAGVFRQRFPQIQPPFILGWDLAGTLLDATGDLPAGQHVLGQIPWFERPSGSYAEVVTMDPSWLAPLPDGVGFAEAATLALNALTGRQALDGLGLSAGQSVLVTGASGAVGGFAAQTAAARGLRVIAIASVGDSDHVRSLGVDQVLERSSDLIAQVRRVAPNGVDGVVDSGEAGPDLVALVRDGGAFSTVNETLAPAAERGIRVFDTHVVARSDQLRTVALDFAKGALTTRIAEVVPLADAADAHRRMAAGGFHGKLVLST